MELKIKIQPKGVDEPVILFVDGSFEAVVEFTHRLKKLTEEKDSNCVLTE